MALTIRQKHIITIKMDKDLARGKVSKVRGVKVWHIPPSNKPLMTLNGGILDWSRKYFDNYFAFFSLGQDDYLPVLMEWVRTRLRWGFRFYRDTDGLIADIRKGNTTS